jgi:transcriptional repressor NF-X1
MNPCAKMLDCANHQCPSLKCHPKCQPCLLKPSLVTHCPCGKYELSQIAPTRNSCIDPILTCGTPFIKILACGHKYKAICGQIDFQCKEKVQKACRCGKEVRIIDCYLQNDFRCDRICKFKKSCSIH